MGRVAVTEVRYSEVGMQYWFNVASGSVEEHDDPSRARNNTLLGPYDSRQEAATALEKARERTTQWDAQDEEWEKGPAG